MTAKCYTGGIPLSLLLSLQSDAPVLVTGYDANKANTVFFSQRVTPEWIKGVNGQLQFNLPLSPENYIMVEIKEEGSKNSAKLLGISNEKLKTKTLYLTPEDQEFVRCAEWFALNSGTLNPGIYQRDHVQFQYFPVIIDQEQGAIPTPARVDHNTGIVEVAKQSFDQYTIPMKMFILEHERVHYVKDTTNESEADLNALNICLSLGYPKMELLYAATKIFPDDAISRARLDAMIRFTENWS